MMLTSFLMVCVFGGLGAVTRFIVNISVRRWWTNRLFPLATFMVNCLAAFCAGIAAAGYANGEVDYDTRTLFVVGFLGGFSTFSTMINEMMALLRGKQLGMAGLYCLLSMVVPVLCMVAGWGVASLAH